VVPWLVVNVMLECAQDAGRVVGVGLMRVLIRSEVEALAGRFNPLNRPL
jgi:hypothetical protein